MPILTPEEICDLVNCEDGPAIPQEGLWWVYALVLLCSINENTSGGGTNVTIVNDCDNPVLTSPCIEASRASTVNTTTATGAGSTTAGAMRVSFANMGNATAVVDGATVPAGTSIPYEGWFDELNKQMVTIPALAYDATGTTLIVVEQL